MTDKEREAFEEWRSKQHYPDNKMIDGVQWEAWQAAIERAKERERELVKLLDEAVFNAKSVIVNMKDMKGGAGFSVREEAEWLEKAVPILKQYESEAE